MDQSIVNIVIGAIGSVFAFLLRSNWETTRQLQKKDEELMDRIAHMEVLVAGEYIKREDLTRLMDRIFTKLDKIEQSLHEKQDRKPN